MSLFDRGVAVILSCKTFPQLLVAERYSVLILNKMREEEVFVSDILKGLSFCGLICERYLSLGLVGELEETPRILGVVLNLMKDYQKQVSNA